MACAGCVSSRLESASSGVYSDEALVDALLQAEGEESELLRSQQFASATEARAFVVRCTNELAASAGETEVASSSTAGQQSATRRAGIAEKLSRPRLDMVTRCIARQCGRDHHDGTASLCLVGCGSTLHIATCAQLGRGYAALASFTCVDCRLRQMVKSPALIATCSEALRLTTLRTLILESSQGAEASAAGFADFTAKEEEYVLRARHERGAGSVRHGSAPP